MTDDGVKFESENAISLYAYAYYKLDGVSSLPSYYYYYFIK